MALSMWASIRVGSMQVDLQTTNAVYSPDVLNDMMVQLQHTFGHTLAAVRAAGLVSIDVEDEDEEPEE